MLLFAGRTKWNIHEYHPIDILLGKCEMADRGRARPVQLTFCSLLLDNEALTPKAATIKSTNLLCGGCKRSARTSR